VKSRAELRAWLAEHHRRTESVWLVTFKKHTPHYLDYGEMIEELLCWGWIDSQTRSVDDHRTSVLIAPRNPKSAWSAINKEKVDAARASGVMTPAGEALAAAARANGMWTFLDDVERLEVPHDLGQALTEAGANATWDGCPRSVKRATLEWIKSAKTARIAETAASAAQGLRPKPFR
jgi:uncharacterized protein YdeI (YjbR/CyaY-like superfamily)